MNQNSFPTIALSYPCTCMKYTCQSCIYRYDLHSIAIPTDASGKAIPYQCNCQRDTCGKCYYNRTYLKKY